MGIVMDFTLSENLGLRSYFREPFSRKGFWIKRPLDSYAEDLIVNMISAAARA